jgi:hypothetical protein
MKIRDPFCSTSRYYFTDALLPELTKNDAIKISVGERKFLRNCAAILRGSEI